MDPFDDSYILQYDEGDYSLQRVTNVWTTSQTSIEYQVKDGDTLQNICHRFYGDSGYWMRLADFNSLDWPLDLPAGLIIHIPRW